MTPRANRTWRLPAFQRLSGVTSWILGLSLILGLMVPAVSLWAHSRSHSFSHWQVSGQSVRATFQVTEIEWQRLIKESGQEVDPVEALTQGLSLSLSGKPCKVGDFEKESGEFGFLRFGAFFVCPGTITDLADLEVGFDLFFDSLPDHLHFAKVTIGDQIHEQVLNSRERHKILADPGAGAIFWDYLVLGVEHILIGIDHLAFLLALLLVCRRARDVIGLVTGFTVGHSITLSLAVLGWVDANVPVVESLIGFTIAVVAVEAWASVSGGHRALAWLGAAALIVWSGLRLVGGPGLPWITLAGLALFTAAYLHLVRDAQWAERTRPLLTVCFGLIHGFGFASVLMDLGLASGRLAASLVGFNLGVEIGQVAVVLLLLAPMAWVWRRPNQGQWVLRVLALALCALGTYWFVQRGLGIVL